VRLDHLLSKEHLTLRGPEPSSKAHVLRWELMGGTFDMASSFRLELSTPLAVGTVGVGGSVPARCWVLRDRMWCRFGGTVRTSGPLVVCPVGQAVRGTARTLRTTQWTRASCSRLSSWLHKMILKIISQFLIRSSGRVEFLIRTHVISSL